MKGWRTIAFGILTAVLAVVSSAEMQTFVAEHLPSVGIGLGTAIVILRALTTSPMFKK